MKNMIFRELTIADHESAHNLWYSTSGVCNCDKCMSADTVENLQKYLTRNPGMSFTALDGERLVGTVLAGHDGRNGMIYRLTVAEDCRERGIGRRLVELSLDALKANGINNVKIFVLNGNEEGNAFWEKLGFMDFSAKASSRYIEM
ncbi:MAG: GNAT family N-acetyltransferase [Oscillospiraceae bacterium]|nr:GNAT family N-acetyltransferase [Oscillospiraceae bacterium]